MSSHQMTSTPKVQEHGQASTDGSSMDDDILVEKRFGLKNEFVRSVTGVNVRGTRIEGVEVGGGGEIWKRRGPTEHVGSGREEATTSRQRTY